MTRVQAKPMIASSRFEEVRHVAHRDPLILIRCPFEDNSPWMTPTRTQRVTTSVAHRPAIIIGKEHRSAPRTRQNRSEVCVSRTPYAGPAIIKSRRLPPRVTSIRFQCVHTPSHSLGARRSCGAQDSLSTHRRAVRASLPELQAKKLPPSIGPACASSQRIAPMQI